MNGPRPYDTAAIERMSDEEYAEFIADQQADEAELDDWLASWSDDFHSDEWAECLPPNVNTSREVA